MRIELKTQDGKFIGIYDNSTVEGGKDLIDAIDYYFNRYGYDYLMMREAVND